MKSIAEASTRREEKPVESASRASGGSLPASPGLGSAVLLVLCGWSLLLAAGALARFGLDRGVALSAALLLGTLLTAVTRPRRPAQRRGALALLLGMGLLSGFATFPAWIALIAGVGRLLGLTPAAPVPPAAGAPLQWLATVGLAPVFEELLYRERLLLALEGRLGAIPALGLSSAAFALPHLEPWSVLGTFLVGLGLGAVMQRSGTVVLCIGLHMGLNLAVLTLGVGSTPFAFGAWVLGAAGGIVLLAALGLTASRPAAPDRPPEAHDACRTPSCRTLTPASRSRARDWAPRG